MNAYFRIWELLIEGSFIGFCISYFITYTLLSFDKKQTIYIKFSAYSIKIISYIGIIFFAYFLYLFNKNLNAFVNFKNVSTMNKIEIYINALEIILSFLSNRALLFSILVLVVWFINEKGLRLNLDKQ